MSQPELRRVRRRAAAARSNRLEHLMQELLEYGKPAALSIEHGDAARSGAARPWRAAARAARAAQVEIRNDMPARCRRC